MEENVIKSISVKKAFKFGVLTNVSAVRVNDSTYPFITVLKGNKASNVYFGKKSAAQVQKDDVLTLDQLKKAEFVLATNEAGEQRVKLSLNGDSAYTNLASIFDDEITADEKEVALALVATLVAAPAEAEPIDAEA